jgi:hypothetical protein
MLMMEPDPARLERAQIDPSQRAPPRPPPKRKIQQVLTIESDTDSDDDEVVVKTSKGKGKAVDRQIKARASILQLSSDQDDERHPSAPTSSGSSSTHQPDPTASPPQITSKQDALNTILAIIPDIDLAHLNALLDQQLSGPGSVAQGRKGYDIGRIVDQILTKGTYPKEGQAERERQAQSERDAKVDWLDLSWRGDGKRMSVQYKDQA